jgi:hypothetical protein
MFVDEILQVVALNKNLQIDFYLFKTPEVIINSRIAKSCEKRINWNKHIAYSNLPKILPEYDAGVVLYKATTKNYEYNAPNKLFEYLSCGLQIWYPEQMKGIHKYNSDQVISIDFESLSKGAELPSMMGRKANNHSYFAEEALSELLTEVKSNLN